MTRLGAIFPRRPGKTDQNILENMTIEEAIVGKSLSTDIFKSFCADLGYDFEIFTDTTGKIYRFRRISPDTSSKDGDVW